MGRLTKGFHFLGVTFQATRIASEKIQLTTTVHPRTCRRALEQAKMRHNGEPLNGKPAKPHSSQAKTKAATIGLPEPKSVVSPGHPCDVQKYLVRRVRK